LAKLAREEKKAGMRMSDRKDITDDLHRAMGDKRGS
jgi:hypothetical protein